jgi:hypothetical protein
LLQLEALATEQTFMSEALATIQEQQTSMSEALATVQEQTSMSAFI